MERRLAAIPAADAVGYSRLVAADEEGTIARLKAALEELIEPGIARHGGRIVKTMGDGLSAEFPSVVDAVRSAVETRRAMAKRAAAAPDDRRIVLRMGMNLGDIVVEGEDILEERGHTRKGGLCCKLGEGASCVIRGLPVHLMILRWPDGPVAMPWPRSGRTVRDRRRARRSGPRRQCRPGGRTSRPGPCAARASPRSP